VLITLHAEGIAHKGAQWKGPLYAVLEIIARFGHTAHFCTQGGCCAALRCSQRRHLLCSTHGSFSLRHSFTVAHTRLLCSTRVLCASYPARPRVPKSALLFNTAAQQAQSDDALPSLLPPAMQHDVHCIDWVLLF